MDEDSGVLSAVDQCHVTNMAGETVKVELQMCSWQGHDLPTTKWLAAAAARLVAVACPNGVSLLRPIFVVIS